jgi:NAD(P)-dependent dehydrogenase (short-subunit alcohol dehydrogenase family)
VSDAEWDLQIDVQLRGAFLLSRAVGKHLIKQGEGGRIILTGSTSGNNARPMRRARRVQGWGDPAFAGASVGNG